ncbi:ATP-binding protein [Sphingomonas sp.]|uniref:AAA family ATPase n=1 Tax=Sphingomonas sp. TaxID=28214 RepID=UPI0025E49715|nr:ATP-binding protein [Sphingomonas sp.]
MVSISDFLDEMELVEPGQMGDRAYVAVNSALDRSDLVVVPDGAIFRGGLLITQLRAIHARVRREGKRLICRDLAAMGPNGFGNGARQVDVPAFTADDYEAIIDNILGGGRVAGVDFDLVFRDAPLLSGYDLRLLSGLLPQEGKINTGQVVAVLHQHILRSNVRIKEVEELTFDSLPGAEHIAAKLETHIILPLENAELARKLDIRPKRGVLLYGPPGTGKTSIGRALAHRMKGKFFLIDGSFPTEPPLNFFGAVQSVVREALENAPCVLFIDDADVLFGIEHIAGFSRYLLSLLDGVESEAINKVCLMMTAMDARKVPAPILRSGRVELWLETRPPDANVRAAILKRWINPALPGVDDMDYLPVAERAEGFTPADLRRVVADAMAFFAADRLSGRPINEAAGYLVRAIDEIRDSRGRMADNLGDESLRLADTPMRGKYAAGIGGLVETNSTCQLIGW